MTTPVVVQGTPVVVQGHPVQNNNNNTNNNYGHASNVQPTTSPHNSYGRGSKQETRCRDPIFALLLYATVAAIAAVAAIYGPSALQSNDDDVNSSSQHDYKGYVIAVIIVALISFAGAALGVIVLMMIPEFLIKTALIFVVAMAGVWMVLAFLSGAIGAGVIGAIFFAFSLCYARMVWSRIPFATVNLVTACTAVKSNCGVVVMAYIFVALAGLWSVGWSIAFVGVFDQTYGCNQTTNVCNNVNYGYLFLLFVAYFFVHQVLQSCIHVQVAGVVGTWWYEPSAGNSCCSEAVTSSFLRTVTTSFGSICFGSLIVAIIEALRMLANTAQANDDGGIMVCIAECILACLASIVEYFNKWAFIYVGLYGYGYLEAGKNVFRLFKNRGWEAIIADDLVQNALLLMSLLVGAIMGCIALILEVTTGLFNNAGGDAKAVSFLLGFVVGLVITSVALSTIGSGVNAVIVLFAEAPREFQQNYPDLSNRMRQTWSQVYPGSV